MAPCAIAEFGRPGARLLAAFSAAVTVGCADRCGVAASAASVKYGISLMLLQFANTPFDKTFTINTSYCFLSRNRSGRIAWQLSIRSGAALSPAPLRRADCAAE